ncbi:DUF2931 family protein [Pedobacter frigidisoli]|uniref:DUF2931 family protein n=1 Tax=Pedobacter frigidisoli TaxID=2530455 RepID=UPI00292E8F1F|nr:DUF2931 family protein [Pedobacter frigidisoli]
MIFKQNRYALLVLVLLAITSCKGQKMEEKFEWTGTVSAPEEYPMEVYKGAIIAQDFTYGFDAIWGTQNTGWGNDGGIMSVTEKQMEAPDSLAFTWLSLMEKKFYTGKWKLDKSRIATLFAQGFIDDRTKQKETYKLVKVGLAPKGKVVVWLSGAGFQTEVGAFQAHDTTITAEQAYDNAKYMFRPDFIAKTLGNDMVMKPEIKAKVAQYGMPDMDVYERYRKKYEWKVNVLVPEGEKVSLVYYNLLNGEEENLFGDALNSYSKRALPKYISVNWMDKAGQRNGVEIKPIDEKEISGAFEALGDESPIDLVIRLNETATDAQLLLKNAKREVKLNSNKVRINKNLD